MARAEAVIGLSKIASVFGRETARAAGVSQSPTTWFLLVELYEQGPLRLSELGERLGLGQPSTTSLVTRLEKLGWVERITDQVDRRGRIVQLAAGGSQALAAWMARIIQELSPATRGWTKDDDETLTRAVRLIESLRSEGPS